MVDTTRYGIGFKTPALPYPPDDYQQQAFIQLNNVLRLYFLQCFLIFKIVSIFKSLL